MGLGEEGGGVNPVIFLDLDGPMIPFGPRAIKGSQAYCIPSSEFPYRSTFAPEAVRIIRTVCNQTLANVVVNSTHNEGHGTIRPAASHVPDLFERNGLADVLHDQAPMTDFPAKPNRAEACVRWLHAFAGPGPWQCVAVDDADRDFVSFNAGKRAEDQLPFVACGEDGLIALDDPIDTLIGALLNLAEPRL